MTENAIFLSKAGPVQPFRPKTAGRRAAIEIAGALH